MPLDLDLLQSGVQFTSRRNCAVTIGEIGGAPQRVRADPAFDPTFALLADYREADLTRLTAKDMQRIAGGTPLEPAAPCAFVAQGQADFGILRMFQACIGLADERRQVGVFRDIDEAMRWLEQVCPPR